MEQVEVGGETPGPRCGHTVTAINSSSSTEAPLCILSFGGATSLEHDGKAGSVRLTGACANAHKLDMHSGNWSHLQVTGDVPEPRAAHAAVAVGQMLVVHGGIAQSGFADAELHVLDLTPEWPQLPVWHTIRASGEKPGPRYAHTLALVHNRYLVAYGGYDGTDVLSDAFVLDTATKPYKWVRVPPPAQGPPARMYHSACFRGSDGLMLVSGGRDAHAKAMSDVFGLTLHRDGTWEWIQAPFSCPSPRYQHASAAVGNHLFVVGGSSTGGHTLLEGTELGSYDTAQHGSGKWLLFDKSDCEAARRCRLAAAGAGAFIVVFGGMSGSTLLDDTLACIAPNIDSSTAAACIDLNAQPWRKLLTRAGIAIPSSMAERSGHDDTATYADANGSNGDAAATADRQHPFGRQDENPAGDAAAAAATLVAAERSNNRLEEAAAEEARAAKEAMGLMRNSMGASLASASVNNAATTVTKQSSQQRRLKASLESSSSPPQQYRHQRSQSTDALTVRLYHRAVVATSHNPAGNETDTIMSSRTGQPSRQQSIDRLQHEARRVNIDSNKGAPLRRMSSADGAARLALSELLRPDTWAPEPDGSFNLGVDAIEELCNRAQDTFAAEDTLLVLDAPIKVFGDIHGQFEELIQLFKHFGVPSTAGDITYIDYLFLGDFVDRGTRSLEVVCLLFALKVNNPESIHLIRGNHEADEINAHFGFKDECVRRLGQRSGERVWQRINEVFEWMPLAAIVQKKILCMHGGIGRSINRLEQIQSIMRPLRMSEGESEVWDLLWSDPTADDGVEGIQPSQRGPGLVAFGPDRVHEFCKSTGIELIVRAHECVLDGFERFAGGKLLTVFSAANYCGTAGNAGALLVVGRDLTVVPKLLLPGHQEHQEHGS